jgi:cytochrome oxidase assembly protein ShyY1
MDRSHLHLAYAFTWLIQLAYAAYVVLRLRRRKSNPAD